VDWIIKDENVGSIFFDTSASEFLLSSLPAVDSSCSTKNTTTTEVSNDDTAKEPTYSWTTSGSKTAPSSSSSSCPSRKSADSNSGHDKHGYGYGIGPDWMLAAKTLLPSQYTVPAVDADGNGPISKSNLNVRLNTLFRCKPYSSAPCVQYRSITAMKLLPSKWPISNILYLWTMAASWTQQDTTQVTRLMPMSSQDLAR
jgi:hypothetical protein